MSKLLSQPDQGEGVTVVVYGPNMNYRFFLDGSSIRAAVELAEMYLESIDVDLDSCELASVQRDYLEEDELAQMSKAETFGDLVLNFGS